MRVFFVMFVFLWCVPEVFGQSFLGLEECRRLAIESNKKLKIADEQILSARAKRQEAFTKYLPGIDAMGSYMRNQKEMNLLSEDAHLPVLSFDPTAQTYRPAVVMNEGRPVMGADGKPVFQQIALLPKEAMTVDDRNTVVMQLGLTQPIYMGGKIRAYNQLAGLAEELAVSGREQELQELILETDEAYWRIVSLLNRCKLADKYVETLKKFEHDLEVMFNTGMVAKADLLSVRVKLNQAEMASLQAEDGLSLSRMSLNQICGLPIDTVCRLKEEMLDGVTPVLPQEMGLEEVYGNRPEVNSLRLATDIYRKKERIARSEYLPSVAFMANYFAMTPSFFDGISTKFDGMWSVGVGVKAPLFHWGASRKKVRSARAETAVMDYKLEEAKERIELQVTQAQFKMKEAIRKMQVAESNQVHADENLRYANLGFQEGTIPVSNVLEAQTAWLSANASVIDARIEVKLCEMYLQRTYGVLGR